jgi:hypothetical protein
MTTTALTLLASSNAALEAELDRIEVARAEVTRLRALLEAAEQEERAAAGWNRSSSRRAQAHGLKAVQALIDGGAATIIVTSSYGDRHQLGGAIVKRTPARLLVLTERGEMEFNLKADTYGRTGSGRGDASSYSIDISTI